MRTFVAFVAIVVVARVKIDLPALTATCEVLMSGPQDPSIHAIRMAWHWMMLEKGDGKGERNMASRGI